MKNTTIKFYQVESNMERASDLFLKYDNFMKKKAKQYANSMGLNNYEELYLECRTIFFEAYASFKEGAGSFARWLSKWIQNGLSNFIRKNYNFIKDEMEEVVRNPVHVRELAFKDSFNTLSDEAKKIVKIALRSNKSPYRIKQLIKKETQWNYYALNKVYKEINLMLNDLKGCY